MAPCFKKADAGRKILSPMYPATDDGYGVPDRGLSCVSVIQCDNLWQYLSSMHLEFDAGIVLVMITDS